MIPDCDAIKDLTAENESDGRAKQVEDGTQRLGQVTQDTQEAREATQDYHRNRDGTHDTHQCALDHRE
jgi:hypothetical protein